MSCGWSGFCSGKMIGVKVEFGVGVWGIIGSDGGVGEWNERGLSRGIGLWGKIDFFG